MKPSQPSPSQFAQALLQKLPSAINGRSSKKHRPPIKVGGLCLELLDPEPLLWQRLYSSSWRFRQPPFRLRRNRTTSRPSANKGKGPPERVSLFLGATDPIRTGDLLITSELLYLLSHSSIWNRHSIASLHRSVKRFLHFHPKDRQKTLKM